jgi:hypothetical protein
LATTTTTATSTKKFSWTAIVKVVQDVKTAVTGVVTNAVQNAITTLGGTNPNQRPSDYQQNGGYYYTESAIEGIGGSVAVGHFTNPELNTFGAPQGSVGGNGAGGSSGASSANGGAGGSGGVPSTGGTSGVGITNDSATLSLLDRLRALLQALLQALFS